MSRFFSLRQAVRSLIGLKPLSPYYGIRRSVMTDIEMAKHGYHRAPLCEIFFRSWHDTDATGAKITDAMLSGAQPHAQISVSRPRPTLRSIRGGLT